MPYLHVYLRDKLVEENELTVKRFVIGRSPGNSLVLPDPNISREHAVIVREGDDFFIEDNNSKNGVFLNRERVQRAQLRAGDELQIFNYVLRFAEEAAESGIEQDAVLKDGEFDRTVFIAVDDLKQLERLRSMKRSAYVAEFQPDGAYKRHVIKSLTFSFGRAADCNVRVGGWFAPRVAATVERLGSRYLLVPTRRGKVLLNNKPLRESVELKDEDRFQVRGGSFQFFKRLSEV